MKYTLIIGLLFIFLSPFCLNAQTIIYFDEDWDEATSDSAHYYRHIYNPIAPDTLYHIQDYFLDGTLQMDGYVTNIKYRDNFIGKVKWFYPNGVLRMFKTYNENHKEFGPTETYIKTGQLRTKGNYEYGTGFDGISPNSTYLAAFTKMERGRLISRLNYYENSLQIAFEDFYRDDEYSVEKTVYYDKDGSILGTLNYTNASYNTIDFGTKVDFYTSYDGIIAKKTISYFQDKKSIKEQISYNKLGEVIAEGINKSGHFHGVFIDDYTQSIVDNGILQKKVYFNEKWDTISTMIYQNGNRWNGIIEGVNATDIFTDGMLIRTRFYSPDKKIIHYRKIFGDPIDSIYWYDKKEQLIGIGIEKDMDPWDGLFVIKNYNSTVYTHYKMGMKEGIQKIFDQVGTTLLSEKTYRNNEVVHDNSRDPLTKKMVECDYPNGKATGVYWEYYKEFTYENGFLIKKRIFEEKEGQLTLDEETHFEATEDNFKIKEIKFFKEKPYTLFYENNRRDHGIEVDKNALFTFKNGDKNGYYELFFEGKSIEKGTYENDQRHGMIHFFSTKEQQIFSCEFAEGNPINGDYVKDLWGAYDRCHYENGKKHGERYNYYHHTQITNYVDGVLHGMSIDSLNDGRIFQGVYKDGAYYNGTFWDPEFSLGESYIDGEKDGLFKSHRGYYVVVYEKFDKGIIEWEQGNFSIGDTIFNEGIYKNKLPFDGTFIRLTDNDNFIISTYKNGEKHGFESIHSTTSDFLLYGQTQYEKGIKNGEYFSIDPKILPKGTRMAVGVYEDNQPFSGSFAASNYFRVWSNFKNGKKHGLEIFEYHDTLDSLMYENGLHLEGTQLESLIINTSDIFKHYFVNGQPIKSTIEYKYDDVVISYDTDSLTLSSNYKIIGLHFDNSLHSNGEISYFDGDVKLGTYHFGNGKIHSGSVRLGDKTLVADKNSISLWKRPKDTEIDTHMAFDNSFVDTFTYQDFYLAFDLFDHPQVISQYLKDGTFLCKLNYDVTQNCFVGMEVRSEITDNGVKYTLIRFDAGKEIVLAHDLNLNGLKSAILRSK